MKALTTLLLLAIIAGPQFACSGAGDLTPSSRVGAQQRAFSDDNGARAAVCKAGDEQISSEADCLQDDAACYPLTTGQWCTGGRGTSCPAGSSALPTGSTCPAGVRCFEVSESLLCGIPLS